MPMEDYLYHYPFLCKYVYDSSKSQFHLDYDVVVNLYQLGQEVVL